MDKIEYEELKNKVLAEQWDFNNDEQRETILDLLDNYRFLHKDVRDKELLDRTVGYINGNIHDKDKQKGILQFLISDKCEIKGLLQTENHLLDIVNVYKLLEEESTRIYWEIVYECKLYDAYTEILMNYEYIDLIDMICLVELLKNYDTFYIPFIETMGTENQIILALALYSNEAKNYIENSQREKIAASLHSSIIRQLWGLNNDITFIDAYELYRESLDKMRCPFTEEIDRDKLYTDVQKCYLKTLIFKACYIPNKVLTEKYTPKTYKLLLHSDLPELTTEEAEELITMVDRIKPNKLQQKIRDHAQNFLETPKPY